ncbi:hypothetical protein TRSC58_03527 [Trypanosoma rangeli SC58]|uniref:Uncharacterized protein n=1 Tax=Trypanosoma rangeli SC58 TaxID=429131 RepID=A0A061J366_TRYRA|nr:hypothetical protein TRSC58_03527 [Trypanosoma rangeli SC58]
MDANNARVERLRRVNRYKAVQAELALLREEEEFKASRERKMNAAARDEALAKQLAEEQRLDLLDTKIASICSHISGTSEPGEAAKACLDEARAQGSGGRDTAITRTTVAGRKRLHCPPERAT